MAGGAPKEPYLREVPARTESARDSTPRIALPGPGDRVGDYELVRQIGQGAMGVVFEASQSSSLRRVALKLLRAPSSRAIAYFKREFRALADLSHPNLVSLYQLVAAENLWFFTMELVDGCSLTEYVGSAQRPSQVSLADTLPTPHWTSESDERLRDATRQLTAGVCALHEAGKLHRDIKPSNVLVTDEGRLVILDFGLVFDLAQQPQESGRIVVGTAGYLSPEQATSDSLTPASDWYSVGVVLYEALTGVLPFRGSVVEVLTLKQEREPPSPQSLNPQIPSDLSALCMQLLQRDPQTRPDGAQILGRLQGRAELRRPLRQSAPATDKQVPLLGRAAHFEELRAAFARVALGESVTIHLHGDSGMGKSALAQRFVDECSTETEAVVLSGRCFERESVAYKGMDTVVEGLSRYLKQLPAVEVAGVLPRDIARLIRLFPSLKWLDSLSVQNRRSAFVSDPVEVRRRAFESLRELLCRLADARPVVIFLDDIQWVDADAADLLVALVSPPYPPPLLLLLSYRPVEEKQQQPFSRLLAAPSPLSLRRAVVEAQAVLEIAVEALDHNSARALASTLLPAELVQRNRQATSIARESGGNPFFIGELVRYTAELSRVRSGADDETRSPPTLEEVIIARIDHLPGEAQRLLEIIAVAGIPVEHDVAVEAASLGTQDYRAIDILCSSYLIRRTGSVDQSFLEPFHDRIRETVLVNLSPATLKLCQRRLAIHLESTGCADPERLAIHFHGAGDLDKARVYARVAADEAASALAFDRATRLYQLALVLGKTDDNDRHDLQIKLADALAQLGRGTEAARVYLAAVEGAEPLDALEYRRRAAEQLTRSGYLEEGLDNFQVVLEAVGEAQPQSKRALVASFLLRRARLRLRATGFTESNESDIPRLDLIRIDTLFAVSLGLAMVDPIRAIDYHTRCVLAALRAGERLRIARALCAEASALAAMGNTDKRSCAMLDTARNLIQTEDAPICQARVAGAATMVAFCQGRWREALGHAEQSLTFLRRCTAVTWEIVTAQVHQLWSLYHLGEFATMRTLLPAYLREADAGDTPYGVTAMRTVAALPCLARGDSDAARTQLQIALDCWTGDSFDAQRYWASFVGVMIALYDSNPQLAVQLTEDCWPAYNESLMTRLHHVRVYMRHLRGASAVALAATHEPDRVRLTRQAENDARLLLREDDRLAEPLAALTLAAVAAVRGEKHRACGSLLVAARQFDAEGMAAFAAAARYHLGGLQGGHKGQTLSAESLEVLAAQQVHAPIQFARMLAPGLRPDDDSESTKES